MKGRMKDKGRKPLQKRVGKSDFGAEQVRLNKYIANSGQCSRREADLLIASGRIRVNGVKVTELGTKINPETDKVQFGGKQLSAEKKVYVLLNKPKNCITTTDDPQGRKTVLDLVRRACPERIYPVGRLDRNTTGLLLLTNDGELARKLTHPSCLVSKVYEVKLDKPLQERDMEQLLSGIELADGPATVDAVAFAGDGKDKTLLGVELHSGRNRVVRRMFEAMDYQVVRLDRMRIGALTKKNLPRGRWRHLSKPEIGMLKMSGRGRGKSDRKKTR
ncbi:MAG: pseudouridine synthase [Flavobacteriales bacterium]